MCLLAVMMVRAAATIGQARQAVMTVSGQAVTVAHTLAGARRHLNDVLRLDWLVGKVMAAGRRLERL